MSGTRAYAPGGTPSFLTKAQQAEKTPPCQLGCPNSGDVRGWIGLIAQHDKNGMTLDEAYDRASPPPDIDMGSRASNRSRRSTTSALARTTASRRAHCTGSSTRR